MGNGKTECNRVFGLTRFQTDPKFYCPPLSPAHFSDEHKKSLRNIPLKRLRDRDRIQTCNRLIRSQLLYSVELRDPIKISTYENFL